MSFGLLVYCFHFHSWRFLLACSTFGNSLFSFRFRKSRHFGALSLSLWLPLHFPLFVLYLLVLVKYTTRYVWYAFFCISSNLICGQPTWNRNSKEAHKTQRKRESEKGKQHTRKIGLPRLGILKRQLIWLVFVLPSGSTRAKRGRIFLFHLLWRFFLWTTEKEVNGLLVLIWASTL